MFLVGDCWKFCNLTLSIRQTCAFIKPNLKKKQSRSNLLVCHKSPKTHVFLSPSCSSLYSIYILGNQFIVSKHLFFHSFSINIIALIWGPFNLISLQFVGLHSSFSGVYLFIFIYYFLGFTGCRILAWAPSIRRCKKHHSFVVSDWFFIWVFVRTSSTERIFSKNGPWEEKEGAS